MEVLKRGIRSEISAITDIAFHELCLLETFRRFSFLEAMGYKLSLSLICYGFEEVIVHYSSLKYKRKISVSVYSTSAEPDNIESINDKSIITSRIKMACTITINNLSFITFKVRRISIHQYIAKEHPLIKIPIVLASQYMQELPKVIEKYASFMRENMMPIIEGKEWIDEYGGLFQRM